MNYLAHIYLSGGREDIIIGNFIADFVKGKEIENYAEKIKHGIILHRRIDEFTDKHPNVIKSRGILWINHRHYSRVILDVFYDYLLIYHWQRYSKTDFIKFIKNFYSAIDRNVEILNNKALRVFTLMKIDNWLYHYSTFRGVDESLKGLSNRTNYENNMKVAIKDLAHHFDELDNLFIPFFDDLKDYSNHQLKLLSDD